jgi:hypothetical protein
MTPTQSPALASQATAELPKPDEIEQRQRDADTARHELLMAIYERHDIASAFFVFDKLAVGKDRNAARDALCEYDRSLLMKIDNLMALSAIAAVGASRAEPQSGHYLWEHPEHPPRVARPEDATFANGDPEWGRCYPVEVFGGASRAQSEWQPIETAPKTTAASTQAPDEAGEAGEVKP